MGNETGTLKMPERKSKKIKDSCQAGAQMLGTQVSAVNAQHSCSDTRRMFLLTTVPEERTKLMERCRAIKLSFTHCKGIMYTYKISEGLLSNCSLLPPRITVLGCFWYRCHSAHNQEGAGAPCFRTIQLYLIQQSSYYLQLLQFMDITTFHILNMVYPQVSIISTTAKQSITTNVVSSFNLFPLSAQTQAPIAFQSICFHTFV